MKFKLIEDFDSGLKNGSAMDVLEEEVLNEDTAQNLKNAIIKQIQRYYPKITLDPQGYILHHIDGTTLSTPTYKDVNNLVLIPKIFASTTSGNDLHHLIHWLKKHKDELNQPFCFGIDDFNPKTKPKVKQFSLMDLVNLLP